MKSPIPWIGGKSQLKSKIIKSFPPTESYNRFIDVFGGGGSILFAKGKHADLEIYNDANSDLVNFFRCLKYHSDELKKEIKYYLNSREMFLDCRERISVTGFTDIQRAAMFYVLVKTGYKQGNKTNGVLALKELLLIAKAVKLHNVGMDKNGTYGKGTAKAVNTLLKKWGYSENGIAGVNFIKKLSDEITKKIK